MRVLYAGNDPVGVLLLNCNPYPTRADIRAGLSGNLCRCTGYQKIVDAVEATARREEETT